MLYNQAARLAPKTQRFYRCQLAPFVSWCQQQGVYEISSLSAHLIRSYLIRLQERELSDYSIHAAARAIRAFLNFCVREELIQVSPMSKVAMPRIDRRILPALSDKEVQRLLQAHAQYGIVDRLLEEQ